MAVSALGQLLCPKCKQPMYRNRSKDIQTSCGTIAAFTCDNCDQTDTVFTFPRKIVGHSGGEGFVA